MAGGRRAAAAGADGLGALVVLVWLIAGLPRDVDALGTVLLIALLVVLGAFALLEAWIARERPAAEERGAQARVDADPG